MIVLAAVVAAVSAVKFPLNVAPSSGGQVVRSSSSILEDGHYEYAYETDNGSAAQESGLGGHNAQGSYRWVSPEGQQFEITYTVDENGYHPSGSAIPVAPEVPPQIARALEYIRAHPYDEARAVAQQQRRF